MKKKQKKTEKHENTSRRRGNSKCDDSTLIQNFGMENLEEAVEHFIPP